MNQKPSFTISESIYTLKQTRDDILFQSASPYNESYLKVSDIHTLWYGQYGNPKGIPAIYLHGGPGGGTSDEYRFFDPKIYRIILLDQRGAGRSTPYAEMNDNNTIALIQDIEKLRTHLNINKWLIVGGSWGSTLSLAYGQKYSSNCLGFVLRGVFLGTESEVENIWSSMGDIFPEAFDDYINFLPEDERSDLMNSYHKRIMDPDPEIHLPAAKSFILYDGIAVSLMDKRKELEASLDTLPYVLSVARAFAHFSVNKFFFSDNQLIEHIGKISHLPCIIVQGRYDIITRPKSAYILNKFWPGSELVFVQDAGHSTNEPGITRELARATEKMKHVIAS